MKVPYWETVKTRRSYYALGKEPVTTDVRIEEIVGEAVKFVSNVLNGTVAANGPVVNQGKVIRIDLQTGGAIPIVTATNDHWVRLL